uniref:LOW QUALITY PROTEIN: GRINL1A combined protein n=1 Tax=Podarcis muralis TaxID=64176 RepID=UPI00109FCA38|nr:LOW QUALITY PROTEIN: GRINL1A combined protein [Podarcis muralis]
MVEEDEEGPRGQCNSSIFIDERHQLQKQLIEYEIQLNGANLHSQSGRQRSHQLEEVTASLRERIKHLDDMVLCQQKKVKHMVEEIELQKRKMKQKELFILQLLEKISFLEGENKELQDRLDYLMESQSRTDVETRDVGVGCDLPLRKFVSRLPDKGKKISSFVEKLKIAIAQEEELQRTTELLSAVRLEFQEKQEAINSSKQKGVVSNKSTCQDPPLISECHYNEIESSLQNKQSVWTKKEKANRSALVGQAPEDTSFPQGSKNVLEVSIARLPKDAQEALDKAENPAQSASSSSEALVDAFERISVGGGECGENSENGQSFDCKGRAFQNFPNTPPKTPHYMEVLELRAKNPVAKRSKFKANVLLAESSGSSCGSPDIPSPRGPPSSLSAEERRHRDKKHLDDITAARLPPLHHEPTQLLSLEDSIAIQIQQKEAYEEMLAKLAAQKLAGRLGPQMASYEPEGETLGNYREVRDEECYSSAED